MARITQAQWKRYTARLSQINKKAEEEFRAWVSDHLGYGNIERKNLIDYGYALATKYGEASAALSAQMYDAVAELSGVVVPAAVPVEVQYSDVAKTVNGIIKNTGNEEILAQGIGRLVKMAGTDTVLSNAHRDRPKGKGSKRKHSGAQVAWIPVGDTCPFCLMLASKGWMNQTEWGAKSHSEHIHANCDCTYAVRFDNKSDVEGYDPGVYKKMYEDAEGSTRDEKFNSMRRQYREENKDKINAQKRAAYAAKKESQHLSAISSKTMGNTVVETVGHISADKIPEAISRYMEQIRNESIEHAYVIQSDGNAFHFTGNSEAVSITGVDLEGAHVIHNHPISNGIVSFGADDFGYIKNHPSAVYDLCNEEYNYHLEVLKNMSELTYNKAERMISKSITEIAATDDYQHEVMIALKENGYIKYERERA